MIDLSTSGPRGSLERERLDLRSTLVTWNHIQPELLELVELDLEKAPMTDVPTGKP